MMVSFIDAHRGRYGVGPVPAFAGMTCAEVPRAPSTYYEHKACEAEPARGPARVRRDGWRCGDIRRVHAEHFDVYGVRKVWRPLRREGVAVARCTVARRMRRMGLQGAVRGRRAKTTHSVVQGEHPDDRVNREFQVRRPNALWVSDPRFHHSGAGSDPRFHGGRLYVATWRGFACTAFVIDAGARRIVGWRVSHSLHTDLALDALEPALHERRAPREGLVTTATGACSISRYATPSATYRWASRPRWEAWATPATTRWPSPSSGCTRRNSSVIPAQAGIHSGPPRAGAARGSGRMLPETRPKTRPSPETRVAGDPTGDPRHRSEGPLGRPERCGDRGLMTTRQRGAGGDSDPPGFGTSCTGVPRYECGQCPRTTLGGGGDHEYTHGFGA